MKVASIGAMVVSPSNPDIIYVGTGDVSMVGSAVNMGNGVWKSVDAGRTWQHIGLEETEHIGTMCDLQYTPPSALRHSYSFGPVSEHAS